MGRHRKKVISGQGIFRESKEDDKLISESTADNEKPGKVTEELAKKEGKFEDAVSHVSGDVEEAMERIKKLISEKELYCRAVISDQNNLEAKVLKFNEGIGAISADLQATSKAWDSEKNDILSQIMAAKKECEEMSRKTERALVQYRAVNDQLESGLDESELSCEELPEKNVENRHQWASEKEKLENNVAELQTRLEYMATERELLNRQNIELSTEVESLKIQLNKSNVIASELKDQVSSIAAAKMFLEKENESLKEEMDRRTLVKWEEKRVSIEKKVRDLETALDSVNKDLDSSRVIIIEKERSIADLQSKLSENAEIKMFMEEKNISSLRDINKRTQLLEEENDSLQLKIRELEARLQSLTMDLQSKDAELQDLKARHTLLSAKSQQKPTPKRQNWKSCLVRSVRRAIQFIAGVILH